MIEKFTFLDYLTALERNLNESAKGSDTDVKLKEITELKAHKANITTMQRHLRHYKSLKFLIDNFGIALV